MPSRQIEHDTYLISCREFMAQIGVVFDSRCKAPQSITLKIMGLGRKDEAWCKHSQYCDYACPMTRGKIELFYNE